MGRCWACGGSGGVCFRIETGRGDAAVEFEADPGAEAEEKEDDEMNDDDDDTDAPAAGAPAVADKDAGAIKGVDDDLERVEDIVVDLLLLLLLWCFGCLAACSWTTMGGPTRSRGNVSGGCSRSELLLQWGPR